MADISELGAGWRLRHSAWLLAPIAGLGVFSFVGFVYCAFRVRTTHWIRSAVVATVLSIGCLIVMLTWVDEKGVATPGSSAITVVTWFAMIAYAVMINRDYLNWRADGWIPRVRPERISLPQVSLAETPDAPSIPVPGPPATPPSETVADEPVLDSVVDEDLSTLEEEQSEGVVIATWKDAEELAAWHMQELGFDDAELTQAGADGGIDVRASHAVAQVKHYTTPVGGPVVQQLRGAAHGYDAALFYALSGFTKAALEYADNADVALFSYDADGQVEPVNLVARALYAQAGGGGFDAAEFQNRLKAQRLGKQYIDAAIKEFFATMEEWLEVAERNPAAAATRMEDEVRRVEDVVHWLEESKRVRVDILLHEIEKINAATERVRQKIDAWR